MPYDSNKIYPAKLLLIGEYSILLGSKALAIPLPAYYITWIHDRNLTKNNSLLNFIIYLEANASIFFYINFYELNKDIHDGWTLWSNIPSGYGLGSSGAVCAAILDRYQTNESNVEETHQRLITMETFFHGSSSGLDPMVSYYQVPIIYNQGIQLLDLSVLHHLHNYNISLIDSKISRRTSELVSLFKNKLQNNSFKENFIKEIALRNNILIDFFIQNKCKEFIDAWKILSKQTQYFYSEMIISDVNKKWDIAYTNNNYLKLNGAGGGGYYLLLSENQSFAKNLWDPMSISAMRK